MTVKQLKSRYPGIWKEVESSVRNDMLSNAPGYLSEIAKNQKSSFISRVAHNAAFEACYSIHKRLRK